MVAVLFLLLLVSFDLATMNADCLSDLMVKTEYGVVEANQCVVVKKHLRDMTYL